MSKPQVWRACRRGLADVGATGRCRRDCQRDGGVQSPSQPPSHSSPSSPAAAAIFPADQLLTLGRQAYIKIVTGKPP